MPYSFGDIVLYNEQVEDFQQCLYFTAFSVQVVFFPTLISFCISGNLRTRNQNAIEGLTAKGTKF